MAKHLSLIGLIFAICWLNLFYYLFFYRATTVIVGKARKEIIETVAFENAAPEVLHERLFHIDPSVLSEALGVSQMSQLQWRYHLPEYPLTHGCLTMGMFGDQEATFTDRKDVTQVEQVNGLLPFSNKKSLLHTFLRWRNINVHVVVLHRVRHFLWIGPIPRERLAQLSKFKIYFGNNEEIYDSFLLNRINAAVQVPDEIGHFLGQMSTSRYIHCPRERQSWMANHNVAISETKIVASEEAILGIKSLMKSLQMQFWMACGTLLGWHRQCSVIPYTSDTDFATWARYLEGDHQTELLLTEAPKHKLRLFYRFGEPTRSMEYSFLTEAYKEKADLFFVYPNTSHYLQPYHVVSKHEYAYSIYPQYQLCSGELLGHKLLVPCDPQQIVQTEYGPNWTVPVAFWKYAESPYNSGPQLAYDFEGSQVDEFVQVYQLLVPIFLVTIPILVAFLLYTSRSLCLPWRASNKACLI